MVFSSIVFLCMFLPLVCGVYFLLPVKARNLWLLIASLCFYAYGEPVYILIMCFSTVFDYTNARVLTWLRANKKSGAAARGILLLSLVGNLGILFFFKYTDFLITSINDFTGGDISLLELALPIGISFYTFQTMSYTIDVYLGKIEAQKNFIDFSMYVCLFPQLIAGPIVRYADIQKEIRNRKGDWKQVHAGLQRFLIGLGKKVLIANQMGEIYEKIQGYHGTDQTMAMVWLGAISYFFQIYYDFSGYSDMAIGLGKIFGFTFPENFDHPYQSKSVTEFWRRWHMTLGIWFREYVYIPLGGNRKGLLCQIRNLAIVWFLTGLWHGAAWNFVLWGMYYFVFLFLEKCTRNLWQGKRKWFQKLLGHGYTLLVVVIGWVIFSTEDLTLLGSRLLALAGIGVDKVNQLAYYEWKEQIIFFLIAGIGATTIPEQILKKWKPSKMKDLAGKVYSVLLLLLSIGYLISGSYNPFLYFRF